MKMKLSIPLLAAGLILSLVACVNQPEDAKSSCCSEVAAPAENASPLSDASLYQIESTWTNDSGKALAFSDLKGQPQLVTMFFSRCEFACPILVHDLERIAKALPETVRSEVGFTLVSFDTARDTPEALKKFRATRRVASDWNLLTGNPDDVLELAALLGVKYKEDSRGQFAHSNIITLLNADGEIVRQQVGLSQSVDEIVRAIELLAKTNLGQKVHAHQP